MFQIVGVLLLKLLTIVVTLLIFISVETIIFNSNQVQAQSVDKPKPKVFDVISSNPTYYSGPKSLHKVGEAIDSGNIDEALSLLDELEVAPDLNPIEKAYFHNYIGNIYFGYDRYDSALAEYKKLIDLKEFISPSFFNQMIYVIAQIYFSQENYNDALVYAKRWFKTQDVPTVDAYILVGQAHYMLEEYDQALPFVLSAFKQHEGRGTVPKEGWLNLLNAIYRKTNQLDKMVSVIEKLNEYYPKKIYQSNLDEIKKKLSQ